MRIVIAGGSGLLGSALTRRLLTDGHEIVHLTRSASGQSGSIRRVAWIPDGSAGPWLRHLDGAEIVVNLAGAGIADRRWSAKRKALIRSSRIDSTRSLVAGILAVDSPPSVFIQGSGIGIYGSGLVDTVLTEDSPPGTGFLGALAAEWEGAAAPGAEAGCRLVCIRTGLVLANEGGALPPMRRPFLFFVGGPVGSGRQWMPWITIDDWVSLVVWAIGNADVSGPLNAVAPNPVRNRDFASALGRALRRPAMIPAPALALRLLLGSEMADELLLGGQRAIPARAEALGFRFGHAEIGSALAHVLGRGHA
jgi:uncharacterized protein (TIGR01777 family)